MPGFNFRDTLAYVTDPTGTVCVPLTLGISYPIVLGAYSYGYEQSSSPYTDHARNRGTTVDARLAGLHFRPNNATARDFRVELPAAGAYNIRLAIGDLTFDAPNGYIEVLDGTTVVATISYTSHVLGTFRDATGVLRSSAADWVTNNAPLSLTVATTTLRLRWGGTALAGYTPVAHLSVESVAPTGPTVTEAVGAGTLNLSGALSLVVSKVIAGSVAPGATLGRSMSKLAGGTVTLGAALVRAPAKQVAGTVTPAATLVKQARKTADGTMTPTGALIKDPRQVLSGTVTPAGTLSQLRSYVRAFVGTVTASGALTALALLARALVGIITPAGAVRRDMQKGMAGNVTSSGTVIKGTAKSVGGTVTPAGSVQRQLARAVGGVITAAGAVVRRAGKVLSGTVTPAATTTRVVWKNVGGQITPVGTVQKAPRKWFSGTVSAVGALLAQLTGSFSVFRSTPAKAAVVEQAQAASFVDTSAHVATFTSSPDSSASWSD